MKRPAFRTLRRQSRTFRCAYVSRLSELRTMCQLFFNYQISTNKHTFMTRTFLDLYRGMFRCTFFFTSGWVSDDSTSDVLMRKDLPLPRDILLLPPMVEEQKRKCAEVHYVAHQDRVSQANSSTGYELEKFRCISTYRMKKPECYYVPLLFLKIPPGASGNVAKV